MARASNALTQGISGKISVLVFRQQADGSPAVVAAAPQKQYRKPHRLEAINQDRFRRAAAYGKAVMSNRGLRAQYGAARTSRLRSAYHVALADALNAPEVVAYTVEEGRGGEGALVWVRATDDFEVVRVVVRIGAADGTVVEEGEAFQDLPGVGGDWWQYRTQGVVGRGGWVEATAHDRPGNATTVRWAVD